ncbi:MAG: 4Fe-4S dicluster domain-containing protein [Proteobacteria bacterium]|nr:4Fe-4S dicluster domain-containing protein [Pseudomonadota bacterium]
MEENRRKFLKVAGASAVGLSVAPVMKAHAIGEYFMPASQTGKHENALIGKHWAMVIDISKLTEDINEKITEACHSAHNVPELENKKHEIKWIWEEHFEHAFTDQRNSYIPDSAKHSPVLVLCNHCVNPPCVKACPTKATFKRDDGIVLMDFHRCIGCRFCMAACPYGSRSFNLEDPRNGLEDRKPKNPQFPTRMKGVVEKCNFCAERLAVGQMPLCAEVSEGAIVFGDLEDPESEVRSILAKSFTIRRKPALGTEPSVYYIVGGGDHA